MSEDEILVSRQAFFDMMVEATQQHVGDFGVVYCNPKAIEPWRCCRCRRFRLRIDMVPRQATCTDCGKVFPWVWLPAWRKTA